MGLKAFIINTTLKKSPQVSNTQALIDKAMRLYNELGVETECVRFVDYNVATGVTSYEGPGDEWPTILEKIKACDIFVIGSPIWFGVRASTTQRVIERLDGTYDEMDMTTGQFPLYNKVAGIIITGNEDGAHNVAETTLFNLTHLGCCVPPNVDAYWVGTAGPGPSYIEAGGEKHLYTNRCVRYMVHNTTFMARLLKEHPITTNLAELTAEAKKESELSDMHPHKLPG
jgi:multimeric flavodoxin WrbA